MLNIVLFGPPGAGKGTQSEKLIQKYGLVHLSTGAIFRQNIKDGTSLGKLAKEYIDRGDLVPDELTIALLQAEVAKHPTSKGFIFDGFPRTTEQAEALDEFLNGKNMPITMMVALEVDEDELKVRLLERAKTSGRSDDADIDIIQSRIETYKQKTAPVANFYERQDKFHSINGEGSVETISERLVAAIHAFN